VPSEARHVDEHVHDRLGGCCSSSTNGVRPRAARGRSWCAVIVLIAAEREMGTVVVRERSCHHAGGARLDDTAARRRHRCAFTAPAVEVALQPRRQRRQRQPAVQRAPSSMPTSRFS
jgi:hypothetical protein